VSYLEPELIEEKPTSVGKAIPGTETLVLDAGGKPVQPGETGILHVRGPHVMVGYWNQPGLTAEMLVDGPIPGEKMLCTHDHFTVDADGFLYFVGRSDDIIKSRGEKVSPVEVENALFSIPGIEEAAVLGAPDELLGEAIHAYVVLGEGVELGEREIVAACRERLESFMVPSKVFFRDELPKTATGKIRKKGLVEPAEEAKTG
jgi:acyl-coenzyme A synthetase/AMP-(fatty) acid ligase